MHCREWVLFWYIREFSYIKLFCGLKYALLQRRMIIVAFQESQGARLWRPRYFCNLPSDGLNFTLVVGGALASARFSLTRITRLTTCNADCIKRTNSVNHYILSPVLQQSLFIQSVWFGGMSSKVVVTAVQGLEELTNSHQAATSKLGIFKEENEQ